MIREINIISRIFRLKQGEFIVLQMARTGRLGSKESAYTH